MEIRINYEQYATLDELQEEDRALILSAKNASLLAYAPYSEFHVGAALLMEDGSILTGNNQENIAYPSGLCAERTALFYAGANFPELKVKRLAIYGAGALLNSQGPVTPCGSCRQVIAETIKRQGSALEILLSGADGRTVKFNDALDLLPLPFGI